MSPSSSLFFWVGIVATWLFFAALRVSRNRAPNSKRRLPPSPFGLPIIGHFHLVSSRPYREMSRLAATYGPVMRLRIGAISTVIVSSPAAAEELFKYHDLAVAGRPQMQGAEILNYKSSTLGVTQYGPYWRAMRKFFTSELFSAHRVDSFAPIRAEELRLLVANLRHSTTTVIDITAEISYLVMDIACRIALGNKLEAEDARKFRWVLREGATILSTVNIADFIPIVGRLGLDPQGLKGKMMQNKKDIKGLLKIIEDRMYGVTKERALIDALVEYMKTDGVEFGFDHNHVKVHIMDILATSVETILTNTEWAFVELLRHPEIMKKARQELDDVVGTDRLVDESHLPNLPYLEMILKESMRLHTPLPLLVPRMAVDDFTLQGFHVPRGSHVVVNAWAIGRDAANWPEPERFWPERFEGMKVDFKGHDFELIPFGSGRRICAGMQFGVSMVRLVLAQLVHCFDWKMPEGVKVEELSMEESYGITAPRAGRLLAIPVYRLNCDV